MKAETTKALAWYRAEWHDGPDEQPEAPAKAADIAEAEAYAAELDRSLPSELTDFWRESDGLQCNGFSVWGVRQRPQPSLHQGFLEANAQLHQLPGLIFIGTCGDEYLALDVATGEVPFVDAVSRDVRPMFPDLDTAIVAIIAPEQDNAWLQQWPSTSRNSPRFRG